MMFLWVGMDFNTLYSLLKYSVTFFVETPMFAISFNATSPMPSTEHKNTVPSHPLPSFLLICTSWSEVMLLAINFFKLQFSTSTASCFSFSLNFCCPLLINSPSFDLNFSHSVSLFSCSSFHFFNVSFSCTWPAWLDLLTCEAFSACCLAGKAGCANSAFPGGGNICDEFPPCSSRASCLPCEMLLPPMASFVKFNYFLLSKISKINEFRFKLVFCSNFGHHQCVQQDLWFSHL